LFLILYPGILDNTNYPANLSVMKRKLVSLIFALFFVIVINPSDVLAQKETFDLLTFTPPAGWTKTLKSDVVMFMSPEKNTGAFCLISIYKSIDGTGNLSTDFSSSWNNLAATRLNITEQPKAEKGESENGWDSQSGSASFNLQGITSVAILTTMSGYSKVMNILVVTSDQLFLKDLEPFYTSIKIDKPSQNQAINQQLQGTSTPAAMSDYLFTVPPGWTKEVFTSEIVLRAPDKVSVLSILPMQPSSGDLENDMKTIFWQVFTGWKPDPWNPDNHISIKGVAPAGWSYFKDEMGIVKEEGDKKYQSYGFIFLAQLNGQVAIIAGSYPSKTNLLDEQYAVDWPLLFHSLAFKNYKSAATSPLANDILGEWLTGSSSSVMTYTFAANGRYGYASAYSTSRDYSSYQVLETTTRFVGDGKYTLKGNDLVMISDRTQKSDARKVRVFYEKQYGEYQKRIGLLNTTSSYDGKSYEVTMAYQNK
jgi:hypothetical protein